MNEKIDLQKGFYLESWLVEPQLGLLTDEDESVQLEPKIMDVLVCLAEHQGEVVKKEYFFKNTWADVNVTQHVLARAISEIRRALKDEPQNPRFIQTVPKIGYRLIASVSANYEKEDFQNPKVNVASSAPPSRARYQQSIPMGLLLFLGGSLFTIIFFAVLIMFMANLHGGGLHRH